MMNPPDHRTKEQWAGLHELARLEKLYHDARLVQFHHVCSREIEQVNALRAAANDGLRRALECIEKALDQGGLPDTEMVDFLDLATRLRPGPLSLPFPDMKRAAEEDGVDLGAVDLGWVWRKMEDLAACHYRLFFTPNEQPLLEAGPPMPGPGDLPFNRIAGWLEAEWTTHDQRVRRLEAGFARLKAAGEVEEARLREAAPLAVSPKVDPHVKGNQWKRIVGGWKANFGGRDYLLRGVGCRLIGALLMNEQKGFSAEELEQVAGLAGGFSLPKTSDVFENLDDAPLAGRSVQTIGSREATANVKEKLEEIEKDIKQAKERHDDLEVERLEERRYWIVREWAKTRGIGGRSREFTDEHTRLVGRAKRAVGRAFDRIAEAEKKEGQGKERGKLASYLRGKIKRGVEFRYHGEEHWTVTM